MIYLDNSATTFPKPLIVVQVANEAMRNFGANPGRGGYKMALKASEEMYKARQVIAEFFNAKSEENVVFTLNCTQAINMVIKGFLKQGDHAVVSCLEHNAVMRPLKALEKNGISHTVADISPYNNDETLDNFRKAIQKNTKLFICTHASNILGYRMPIERLSALAHQYGIMILVDSAQSAGVLPIDITEGGIDFLCGAGHKGLYGVMGVGFLITDKSDLLDTIIEGGTGSNSISFEQPTLMPDKFESGTPNLSGIVALRYGVQFVKSKGIDKIYSHEFSLINELYNNLSKNKKVKLYIPRLEYGFIAPLLSFNIKGYDSETIAEILGKNDIAVRAGLHCAPLAHKFISTEDTGTVRVSPSIFTTQKDIAYLEKVISKI